MAAIVQEVEPDEIGLDATRLGRLGARLEAYVERSAWIGTLTLISRGGRVGYVHRAGWRDAASRRPVETDTIWRLYSMTKPVTSVAALMLCEAGALRLTDPVADYIPAFADPRIFQVGTAAAPVTVPARGPIRVGHLLSHTSGLTYPFWMRDPVDEAYRLALGDGSGFATLAAWCERVGSLPLLFEPGSEWNYSVSTDILARVVEVASGQCLDGFFAERIFRPLGMRDTGFLLPADDARLATLYAFDPRTATVRPAPAEWRMELPFPTGGTGLVSTAADYHRFTQMLRRGGALDRARLLSPATVALMTHNHLPGGKDIPSAARPGTLAREFPGRGFGLGFAVLTDPVAANTIATRGEYSWGGAAGTEFWVDPARDLTVLFFTQVLGAPAEHALRRELRWLVYQALVD